MTETVKKKSDRLAVRLEAKLHSDPLQAPETERLIVPDSQQQDFVHGTLVTNKATFCPLQALKRNILIGLDSQQRS